MSKINPNLQVEAFARDARNTVVQVLVKKIRTVMRSVPTSSFGIRMLNSRKASFSFGTGFVIKSNNTGSIVLTASHVVRGINLAAGDRLYVRVEGGQHRVRQLRAHVLHRHRHADVAILSVPGLRSVQSLNFDAGMSETGIIGVGFANAEHLFTDIPMAMKLFSDLSPGSVLETEPGPIQNEVKISNHHMDMVAMQGMSGCPVVNARGAIGMLIIGEGAYCNAASTDTICQVMKQYYKICLRQARPTLSDAELHAVVGPMTIEEVAAVL